MTGNQSAVPVSQRAREINLQSALVVAGLCESESEAARLIRGGGAYIDGEKATAQTMVAEGCRLSAGREHHAVLRFEREISTNKDETIAKLREAFNAGWSALDGERDQRSHNVMSDYERDSLFAGFITSLTSTKKEG